MNSCKEERFPLALLVWPELGEREEDRIERLPRADVWLEEMESEREYGIRVGE